MNTIFFAVIAFYVFMKLREQLGKVGEDEKDHLKNQAALKKQIISIVQDKVNIPNPVNEAEIKVSDEISSSLDAESKEQFLKILTTCNISADFFLKGSKSAFEMVIKAFAANDSETLKTLLEEKNYLGFKKSIDERESLGQTLVSNVISIEEAKIISAHMFANEASITIKFTSKQINYVTDKEGEIIDGRKDEVTDLNDVWRFKKDVTASNPNWIIVSTNSNT